jgi:hypothetical protein
MTKSKISLAVVVVLAIALFLATDGVYWLFHGHVRDGAFAVGVGILTTLYVLYPPQFSKS